MARAESRDAARRVFGAHERRPDRHRRRRRSVTSQRSRRRAVISLGTNSTRVLIVDVAPDGTLIERYHEAVLTRLGEGLGASGLLLPEAAERTLAVVRRYTDRVRAEGAETSAITTSVMRRAEDGEAFRTRFREIAGVDLRILSGEEEARHSFMGATHGTVPTERVAVLDIGGGSTECAVGRTDVESAISVEIGAVRLTEMFPALAGHESPAAARAAATAAERYVDYIVGPAFAELHAERLMAVAGTPRTLGAIASARPGASIVDGRVLSKSEVDSVLAELLALPYVSRRKVPGMTPERADILAAGAIILLSMLRRLSLTETIITRNDLLLGYLAASASEG